MSTDPALEVLAPVVAARAVGRLLAVGGPLPGATARWVRNATEPEAGAPTPFPPDGPFDGIALRLPKSRDGLQLALHWLGARLAPEGRLWLSGHNDEGIRSAGDRLSELFREVEVVDTRRHCRVFEARGLVGAVRGDVEAWREPCADAGLSWSAWPGGFAHGRVDAGTALLLSVLPKIEELAGLSEVVDLCCGVGIIALAVRARCPDARILGLDADALSVEAARRNLPGATLRVADGWAGESGEHRLVLSNPPFHQGVTSALNLPSRLLGDAPVAVGGWLVAVVPKTMTLSFPERFAEPVRLADDGRYRVWAFQRVKPRPAPKRRR